MTIDLFIEALTHGGRGLGRHQGKAVFVPLTMPGDRVRVKLLKEKKRYAVAELVEVMEPAPERRAPPCPYFGSCGGCQWQHLPYKLQTEWKNRIFSEMLLREKLTEPDAVLSIATAPAEFRYRNRVQLKCRQTQKGFVAGFYRSGTHTIEDITHCMLVEPEIQSFYERLRNKLSDAPASLGISQVDVSISDDKRLHVVIHTLLERSSALREWLHDFAAEQGVDASLQAGCKHRLELVHGDSRLGYNVGAPPVRLEVSAGGFTQVNTAQNRTLVTDLVELAALRQDESVLDLFCGMGNFSLPLACQASSVVGVEAYAPAIRDAKENARRNRLTNTRFIAEDATRALRAFMGDGQKFDLVILDPPRAGCYPVVSALLELLPRRIIYVSCDPASLVRDLKLLVDNGYRIVSARAYDLFPQTWHIESMTLLER